MNPIVLIPARMAATRLPGKPLADIEGRPMILRALDCAQAARVGPVAVAAGDAEIYSAVVADGGSAVMTDPALPSGSDRILSALRQLDPQGRHDAVINMQGDMPFAAAEDDAAAKANPDVVKAVLSLDSAATGRALYFTRSTLFGDGPVFRHIGVYGYTRAALEAFNAAPPSPLEKREKLEQLRAMELGLTIRAAVIAAAPIAVDSPADLEAARRYARDHGR